MYFPQLRQVIPVMDLCGNTFRPRAGFERARLMVYLVNNMRRISILLLFFIIGVAGCESLAPEDHNLLVAHHVSPVLLDKMQHGARLEFADIVELSQRHVPDPFTIRYLQTTYAVYQLNTDDVSMLKHSGVSNRVIDYLLATPSMYNPPYRNYPDYPYPYPYPYGGLYPYGPVIIVHPGFHHHH
jgi:hypothetical protein